MDLDRVRRRYFNTPMRAVRQKCLDCTCQQQTEVRECPIVECPLWEYRMGKNPEWKKKRPPKGPKG